MPTIFRKRELEGFEGEGAETVEPILDSFGGYSTDNLSNFYYPYIIVLLMIFRDEVSFEPPTCRNYFSKRLCMSYILGTAYYPKPQKRLSLGTIPTVVGDSLRHGRTRRARGMPSLPDDRPYCPRKAPWHAKGIT